jgi:hypothetical protein
MRPSPTEKIMQGHLLVKRFACDQLDVSGALMNDFCAPTLGMTGVKFGSGSARNA